ncbi:MAG: AAA family ATPase [Patescibacteria group bacterium]|nr:AAA family ATPase [Patescibacteria group bacterium]
MRERRIIVYGVPGSGKTALARKLAKQLRLPHIEADAFRSIAQKGKILPKHPFYFLATTEAYQAIGRRTKKNIITGLLNVRKALDPTIAKQIKKHKKGFVLEAAFLDPKRFIKTSKLIFLAPPIQEHKRQFFIHRKKDAFHKMQFQNTRIIQEFLKKEAKELKIPIFKS